jgi:hypothetical protein
MTSNKLSKHDQDFANAMATKLRLNREKLNHKSSGSSVQANEPPEPVEEDFRESLIQKGLEEFPGLTWEEAEKMLNEMGF